MAAGEPELIESMSCSGDPSGEGAMPRVQEHRGEVSCDPGRLRDLRLRHEACGGVLLRVRRVPVRKASPRRRIARRSCLTT